MNATSGTWELGSKGLTFRSFKVSEEEEKETGIEKNIQRNHDRKLPKFDKRHKFIFNNLSEKHTYRKNPCLDTL